MPRFCLALIALAVVYAGPASGDELTPKDLAAARKIYVAKCAKCHRFYEPKEYSDADWRTWMEKMNRKSKLKPAPGDLLIRYVDEYRAGRIPKIP